MEKVIDLEKKPTLEENWIQFEECNCEFTALPNNPVFFPIWFVLCAGSSLCFSSIAIRSSSSFFLFLLLLILYFRFFLTAFICLFVFTICLAARKMSQSFSSCTFQTFSLVKDNHALMHDPGAHPFLFLFFFLNILSIFIIWT